MKKFLYALMLPLCAQLLALEPIQQAPARRLNDTLWCTEQNYQLTGWTPWKAISFEVYNEEAEEEVKTEISKLAFTGNGSFLSALSHKQDTAKIWDAGDNSLEALYQTPADETITDLIGTHNSFIMLNTAPEVSTLELISPPHYLPKKFISLSSPLYGNILQTIFNGVIHFIEYDGNKIIVIGEHYDSQRDQTYNRGIVFNPETGTTQELGKEIADCQITHYNRSQKIIAGFNKNENSVKLWSVTHNRKIRDIIVNGPVTAIALNNTGTEIAVIFNNNLAIYTTITGQLTAGVQLQDTPTSIVLNNSAQEIILTFNNQPRIDFLSRTTGQLRKRILFHTQPSATPPIAGSITVNHLICTPDGKMAAAAVNVTHPSNSYALILKSSIEENPANLFNLAQQYLLGHGQSQNYTRARDLFMQLSEQSKDQNIKIKSLITLAGMNTRAEGFPQADLQAAERLYRTALEEPGITTEDKNRAEVALKLIARRKRQRRT